MEMTYTPKHLEKWTRPDNWFGKPWPDYYVGLPGIHRDSDCLSQSNFHCALRELGGESETVVVVRESHWAVGWIEWIAIHESDSKALETADEIVAALADYPVLDEDDFFEREMEAANEVWSNCYSDLERIAYIRENRSQFEFHDMAELIACARGKYFAGYASELLL